MGVHGNVFRESEHILAILVRESLRVGMSRKIQRDQERFRQDPGQVWQDREDLAGSCRILQETPKVALSLVKMQREVPHYNQARLGKTV